MSRIPVREALVRLQQEGYVESGPGRSGSRVRRLSAHHVLDLYRIRAALEHLAVELAVHQITDADISYLRGLVDEVNEHGVRGPEMGAIFHRTLAAASGNDPLFRLICSYDDQITWAATSLSGQRRIEAWKEHQSVVDALMLRDGSAVDAMRDHTTAHTAFFASLAEEERRSSLRPRGFDASSQTGQRQR